MYAVFWLAIKAESPHTNKNMFAFGFLSYVIGTSSSVFFLFVLISRIHLGFGRTHFRIDLFANIAN